MKITVAGAGENVGKAQRFLRSFFQAPGVKSARFSADFHRCAFSTARRARQFSDSIRMGTFDTHRPRYESTSTTAETVKYGLSSGDDALWSDIAYSDAVRVSYSGLHYRACAGLKPSVCFQRK